ncbi:MAG: type IV pilus twitching motility protein PilT [Deltaproteobacteria bacterium]|nr:type IV pilus twitching motility protein PilT [Deltaproteobacteria bacterium]
MSAVLDRVLAAARKLGASDVHLKAGLPPIFRIGGELRTVRDVPAVTREAIGAFAANMMTDRQREEFERSYDCDLAYQSPDGTRYRVNVFQQRGTLGMVMRLIPPEVPAFETLLLPSVILKLAEESRGLILVTGITGSGKSTTLASMVDYINARQACHIVTIEDPIEYAFRDRRSIVNQRELGLDTISFARALRASLRQDPDVILVGEMRDLETCEIAMTAAETGHLVMSTLHTVDAVETINRIISIFPPHQQGHVRIQLAAIIKGVISQRLIPRADGKGMVPAVEIMVSTQRIRELIVEPKRTVEIHDAIATGRHPYGMQSFDQALTELVHKKLISYEEAVKAASNADDFALHFKGIQTGSSNESAADFMRDQQAAVRRQAGSGPPAQGGQPDPGFQIDRFGKE